MLSWGFQANVEITMLQAPLKACIDACYACATACDYCASSCLQEEDVKMMAGCITHDMDCAQMCRTAAGFMARGSDFAQQLCRLCAEVCTACAEECGKHPMDHCQACARACRACADACRRMAQAA